ncbi:2-oxo-4-hydroxy-4-carboxy-5-ureidoimidazoline decarboxylase [Nocardia vaccinii]|uniref:2-oxo-4-hydroxy-4-carboxy-5-ureidoimidazoline decarboxylase n=1 Tax=Nocardia vaccinii TaxID=1822 RepID=UPI000A5F01C2|nr:2-oxo-4-hydroxy-4-carboxy-5-ureidoimidazoline decarboxylase [Nocardia vaccinii]
MRLPLTMAQLNELPEDDWRDTLRAVIGLVEWIDAVAAARPYPDRATLLSLAEREVLALRPEQVRAALADHPRIGAATVPGSSAAREQSGVDPADAALLERLRAGNRAYEARFGRIYLVCAAGRSGPELLADLTARLDNDPDTEIHVTRTELAAITRKRLEGTVIP